MENILIIIDYIARTNLFNFIIFISIIAFLVKKVDVASLLEKKQVEVKNNIIESESAKVDSEEKLKIIKTFLINIQNTINSILLKSQENANLVGEKYLKDSEKTKSIIQENADKTKENNKLILKNELLKKISLASVEVAKDYIKNELNKNSELHDKLIDESIDSIEGVSL